MIAAVTALVRPGTLTVTWTGLTTTDRDGDWLVAPDYPDKTVEVWGAFTTAAAVQIEGKCGGVGTEAGDPINGPVRLNDSRGEGNPAVSGGKNCYVLNENPAAIRPYLTSGDGDTLVNVRITCTARQV